jgi:hypothetical protein
MARNGVKYTPQSDRCEISIMRCATIFSAALYEVLTNGKIFGALANPTDEKTAQGRRDLLLGLMRKAKFVYGFKWVRIVDCDTAKTTKWQSLNNVELDVDDRRDLPFRKLPTAPQRG